MYFSYRCLKNALSKRMSNLLKGLSNSYYKQAFHDAMHIIGNAGHFFDEDSESQVWRLAGISRLSARPEVEALIAHWNEVDAKRSSERAH